MSKLLFSKGTNHWRKEYLFLFLQAILFSSQPRQTAEQVLGPHVQYCLLFGATLVLLLYLLIDTNHPKTTIRNIVHFGALQCDRDNKEAQALQSNGVDKETLWLPCCIKQYVHLLQLC